MSPLPGIVVSFAGVRSAVLAAVLAATLGGCASLPPQTGRVESHALPDTAQTRLGRESAPLLSAHRDDSGFRLLPDGVDALLARIVLAEVAERSLDVQYYIWHDDLTGRHFAHALLRAADRGVRIRVLLDDVGARADDRTLLTLDAHPNIEIRLFNPVASRSFRGLGMLADFARTNRRMHNKAFVADNRAAVLGGRNIGDEYFGAHGDMVFSDLDVLTIGPVVPRVSEAFDAFWNAPASYPIATLLGRREEGPKLDALREALAAFIEEQRGSPYVVNADARLAELLERGDDGFAWGDAHLLFDDPAKITRAPDVVEGSLLGKFADLRVPLKKELFLVSPYFVPGDEGVAWMRGLVRDGVRVKVLTNSLAATDVGAVHSGYQRYREPLLAAGVTLYELRPGAVQRAREGGKRRFLSASRASLHAKTFVFDRRALFIGSLNFDPRSVALNTEIGVLCESPPLAEELTGRLEAALDGIAWRLELTVDAAGGTRIAWVEKGADGERRHFEEPEVGAWRKLLVWLLGLLPIESQL